LLTDYRLQSTAEFEAVVGRQLAVVKKLDILPKETINQTIAETKAKQAVPRSFGAGAIKSTLKLPRFSQVSVNLEEARWPLYLCVSILVLSLLIWGGFFFYYKSLQQKKDALNKRAEEIYTSNNKDMAAKILNLEKDLKKVENIIDAHVYASRGLKFLEDYTLPNVQFIDFNLDVKSGVISAKGLAQTYAVLARQILLLEKQNSIGSVNISGVSLDQLGGVGFSLEAVFKSDFFNKK